MHLNGEADAEALFTQRIFRRVDVEEQMVLECKFEAKQRKISQLCLHMQDFSLFLLLLGDSFFNFSFHLYFCMIYRYNAHPVYRLPFLPLTNEHTCASDTLFYKRVVSELLR